MAGPDPRDRQRSRRQDEGTVLGLPDWVAVAIGCYAAVAVLNSIAWLLTDVPERLPDDIAPSAEPSGDES